jgi:hypothetical protein
LFHTFGIPLHHFLSVFSPLLTSSFFIVRLLRTERKTREYLIRPCERLAVTSH